MTTNHISSNNCFVIAHGRPLGPITIVGTWDNLDDATCYAETSIEDCKTNQYSIVKLIAIGNNIIDGAYAVAIGDVHTGYKLFGPFLGALTADLFGRNWMKEGYTVVPIAKYAE